MLASGSALLSRLLGPEEDMSTSQLWLLDDLERVVSQLQGIRQPEEFEVGDVCTVTRGRVDVIDEERPTSGYRPAPPLSEQTPDRGEEVPAPPEPTSPWQSLLEGSAALEQASSADGLSAELREQLQEQARAQAETAARLQAEEVARNIELEESRPENGASASEPTE